MSKVEVLKIVREMPVRSDEVRDIVWALENATDITPFNLMNIFNYGYMIGKQEERAKKRKAIN